MTKILVIVILLIITLSSAVALAHPGGLDQNGGHYNRKTGQYHKHR